MATRSAILKNQWVWRDRIAQHHRLNLFLNIYEFPDEILKNQWVWRHFNILRYLLLEDTNFIKELMITTISDPFITNCCKLKKIPLVMCIEWHLKVVLVMYIKGNEVWYISGMQMPCGKQRSKILCKNMLLITFWKKKKRLSSNCVYEVGNVK